MIRLAIADSRILSIRQVSTTFVGDGGLMNFSTLIAISGAALILGACSSGPPLDVPAGTYSLNFDSLPSAQGWTFMQNGPAENDVFSVDGTRLTQDTFGSGTSSFARYQIDGVADPNKQMVLSLTARVLRHENLTGRSTGLGFNFVISDGVFLHRLALTADQIQVGGQFYKLNTTGFHDYSFELYPGGNFDLYVDGVIFATGVGYETVSSNKIFFGDSTSHENADAEITAMSFTVGAN
jgi:hypothetical protein